LQHANICENKKIKKIGQSVADPGRFQEIDFNPVGLNAVIEQLDRDSLIEQSD